MKQRDMKYTGGVKKIVELFYLQDEKKEIHPTAQSKEFMGSN
jgi:hypothetical protein